MKVKKQGWINIHKMPKGRTVSGIFESKEKAEEWIKDFPILPPQAINITTQIDWEEEV